MVIASVAAGTALVALTLLALRTKDRAPDDPSAGSAGLPRLHEPPSHLPVPVEVPNEAQVTRVMELWRQGIQNRDQDIVLSCDQIFRERPAMFTEALLKSAQSDGEDRIRAFSTRVLGKFQNAALVPAFRRLLADHHAYVRSNAAWALGQLRSAEATPDLDRLRRTDPVGEVREAAAEALGQVAPVARGNGRR